jgi:hypothetical protein
MYVDRIGKQRIICIFGVRVTHQNHQDECAEEKSRLHGKLLKVRNAPASLTCNAGTRVQNAEP